MNERPTIDDDDEDDKSVMNFKSLIEKTFVSRVYYARRLSLKQQMTHFLFCVNYILMNLLWPEKKLKKILRIFGFFEDAQSARKELIFMMWFWPFNER